jgi:hypothetical protein
MLSTEPADLIGGLFFYGTFCGLGLGATPD